MANPNLYSATTITANTLTAALTTNSAITLLSGSANQVRKINTIVIANINGLNAASCNVSYFDGTNDRQFASQVSVPAGSTLVLIDRNSGFYITEGQEIRGGASLNSYLTALVSYETIS
jgi:hypothetical protein